MVWQGAWTADGTGEWRTGDITLANGHYKAFAKQMNEATPGGNKQKVFWIECGATTGGTGPTGSTGSSGGSSGGNNSGGNSGGNNAGGAAGGTTGGGNSGGTSTSGGTTSGGTTVTTGVAGSTSGAVAGVQTAPQSAQAIQGLGNLPSTSTDTGRIPLVLLGMVLLTTGVVLLRRPAIVPNP
jgi:LPXTG-motif cell wall-anchored protein